MKKNQNFKDHINYFKKTDTLKYVGGVFAVLGDGECNEGSVWEAAMCAARFSLSNLVLIVVLDQLLTQRTIAVAGAVFEHLTVDRAQRTQTHIGGLQVGLTDVQVVDLRTTRLGSIGQGA